MKDKRDKIIELLLDLDNIARAYDGYEFGLPVYLDGPFLDMMVEKVEEWLNKEEKDD